MRPGAESSVPASRPVDDDHDRPAPIALPIVSKGAKTSALVVLVPLLVIGIHSTARGRVLLGTSLIVAGIVAAVPTMGCDLPIYSMRTIR